MRFKVWNADIRPPQPPSDKWEFHSVTIYNDDESVMDTRPFVISDPQLQDCFKEATGRNLDVSGGSTSEKRDLLENWAGVEPKLAALFQGFFVIHN